MTHYDETEWPENEDGDLCELYDSDGKLVGSASNRDGSGLCEYRSATIAVRPSKKSAKDAVLRIHRFRLRLPLSDHPFKFKSRSPHHFYSVA
jgi:hypothetical protein